jgi:multiple sugar transport system substrate-binding protein
LTAASPALYHETGETVHSPEDPVSRKSVLLLALLVAALAGCSTKGADEGKTAVAYTRWGDPAELESTRELIAQFMKENPDIVVRVDVVAWRQYWQKMSTAVVTGTAQDVWLVAPSHFEQYVAAGHVLDLTPFMERDGVDPADYLDGCFEEFCYARTATDMRNVPLSEGHMYAFPRDYNCSVLFYNRDHFDAAGVPYPADDWTWADMAAAARKLTIDFDGDGIIDQWGTSPPSQWTLAGTVGGSIVDAVARRGSCAPANGDTRVLDAFTFCRDVIYKHRAAPPPTIQLEGDTFITGKTSMIIEGVWEFRNFNRSKYLWDIAPVPVDVKGRPREREAGGTGHCIYSKSKVPEAAWQLVKFLSSDLSQRELGRSGTSVPSLISAGRSADFLAPFDRPSREKHDVIFRSLAQGKYKPAYTRGYLEYENYARQTLQSVWLGTRTPEEACLLIDKETDRVLAEQYGGAGQ